MQALILDEDPTFQTKLTVALMTSGFHVLNAMSTTMGLAMARRGSIDLLVMADYVEDRLSHSVALSAERHSPYVSTILRTTRTDNDLQELYDVRPSLYGILGKGIPVEIIAKLGMSGVAGATRKDTYQEPIPFHAMQAGATAQSKIDDALTKPLILHPKLRIPPKTPHPRTPASASPVPELVAWSGSS